METLKRSNNSAPAARIRVFLVDAQPVLRKGLHAVIGACPDMEICGEASSSAEALEKLPEALPRVVVADIFMPEGNGIDLILDLRLRHPAASVLVFTMHDENLYAERSLRAGAQGFVMKQETPERLLEGLRMVARGELFVSENLKKNMLSNFLVPAAHCAPKTGVERLSDRELQVFESIGRGLSTAEIALAHNLSPKTIETYRANIRRKLGLKNGFQLVHSAVRWVDCSVPKVGSDAIGDNRTPKIGRG